MNFQNGEVGFVNLLFLLVPMLIVISFYAGRSSIKSNIQPDTLFRWKLIKKVVRTCPKHATMIKVKEMAILDHKNCDYCKKEIL